VEADLRRADRAWPEGRHGSPGDRRDPAGAWRRSSMDDRGRRARRRAAPGGVVRCSRRRVRGRADACRDAEPTRGPRRLRPADAHGRFSRRAARGDGRRRRAGRQRRQQRRARRRRGRRHRVPAAGGRQRGIRRRDRAPRRQARTPRAHERVVSGRGGSTVRHSRAGRRLRSDLRALRRAVPPAVGRREAAVWQPSRSALDSQRRRPRRAHGAATDAAAMKVLILCGGLGTRLAGASGDLPKPMVPVGGKPMVWHIMKGFAHWGYRDFVLCLGYRSDLFKQYFLNLATMLHDVTLDLSNGGQPFVHQRPPEMDWKITLAETGLDALTGARVKRGGAFVPADDDVFAVTYGDGVTNVDFRKVVAFHRAPGKLATV